MLGEGWTWIGTDWAQDSLFEEFTVDGAELNKLKDEMKGIVAMRPAVDLTAVSSHVHRRIFSLERNISRDMALCPHVGDATAVSTVAYFAYDAVLVAATAVSRAIAKYGEAAASNFTAVLGEVRGMGSNPVKDGATGNIVLDANGDRAMPYALVNLRDVGKWEIVGEYKAGGPLKLFGDDDDSKVITWPDGSTEIPADREERHTSTAALYLFLFLTFIVLSICVGNFLHSHHFYYLPESGAVVILGLIFGAGLRQMSGATHYQHTLIEMTEFDTELFTLVLLPVIIFSAGFNLKKADLMRNFTPILLTAFIGTAISTLVVAGAVYHLGNEGHFEFGKFTGPESLAFGALVSAVDPVATLAVFGALGVETNLNMRVFGESVLNDGVSIVLFRVFTGFFTEEVNNESIMAGVGMFLYIVIGSVFAGAFTAILVAIVLKHASMHSHVLEAGIVILGSYMAFAGAEALGMSGIIASLFCGIGMNHWTYHNFTYDGEVLARRSIRMFSLLADTVIFFQVGQNIVVNVVNPDWTLIGATLVACLIGRMCNIFPLCNLYNLFVSAPHRVSLKDQIVMVHAGLRGAIAFALALTFPSHNIHIVLNTTMWVILFTIFVMGGTCVPMLRMLNVDMGVKSNEVGDSKLSRHSRELTSCMQKVDRLGILPIVTWRFTYDGADTYIENPHEARALSERSYNNRAWPGICMHHVMLS
jgi:sodium/hydrogen exchanger 8